LILWDSNRPINAEEEKKSEFQITQKQKTHPANQELTLDFASLWDDCDKK